MNAFPPGPPLATGVVLVTLSTGVEIQAEWDGETWWMHLDNNPNATPIENDHVVSWQTQG